MNLSIEDLEAIKAIVHKAVKDELEYVLRQQAKAQAKAKAAEPRPAPLQPRPQPQPKHEESQEIVAHIRR